MFSFVEDAISGIISSILSQFNFIQDLITAPIRQMVSSVLAGVWRGDGANRFAAEMTNEVIPMLGGLLTGGSNFAGAIKKSQDLMLQGFQQAASIAQTLFDPFNSIF